MKTTAYPGCFRPTADAAEKLANAPRKALGRMNRQIYEGLNISHGVIPFFTTAREFMDFVAPPIRKVEIKDRDEGIKAFPEKRPSNFVAL